MAEAVFPPVMTGGKHTLCNLGVDTVFKAADPTHGKNGHALRCHLYLAGHRTSKRT